jgi:hypothetical protein
MVIALYPVDEPDIHPRISEAMLTRALQDIRTNWPGPKLAVIYGDAGRPYTAIASYDWIGKDKYEAGSGILNIMPSIRADQAWIIVPGGVEPWHQHPADFEAFAQANANVALVMPFVWFDDEFENAPRRGIRGNGLAKAYCEVGQRIKSPAQAPNYPNVIHAP